MVRKKIIGKIQLIIGIIIFLLGVIGLIYSLILHNDLKEKMYDLDIPDIKPSSDVSNDTQRILVVEYIIFQLNQILFNQQKVIILILFSSLAVILSLLFIFRGLINMSEQKLKQMKY